MGLYIEPNIDKLQWCENNGDFLKESRLSVEIPYDIPVDSSIVCLVDNGVFYAGAVAYSESEFKSFNIPDGRNKYWFVIKNELLKPICPMWEEYHVNN